MSETSFLTDALIRDLIAVGQVDILVGIPSMNHADCIAPVVRAVHTGLDRDFLRERTVVVHLDGGSTDGTQDVVQAAGQGESDTLTLPRPLRTRHRILAPYHGVPGLALALRQLFTVADLLQARAIAVFDPEVSSVDPSWVAALVRPVLHHRLDFVAPVYARHPLEGLLVSQLVRPLVRTAYGAPVREPVGGDFACSSAFAARALVETPWEEVGVRSAPDLWLTTLAMARGLKLGQAAMGPRRLAPREGRPAVQVMFGQIVGALMFGLERHAAFWTVRAGVEPLPTFGELHAPPPEPPPFDAPGAETAFRTALASPDPVLEAVLDATTLAGLRHAAADLSDFDDDLWARVVSDFTAAHHRGGVPGERLGALVPLHLGRAAAFAGRVGDDPARAEAALEALALAFERARPYLVERWKAANAGGA